MQAQQQIKSIPFSPTAYAQLQADLTRLIQEEKDVIVRLQVAREMGDLSENGAYIYAKMELGATRRKLRTLRHLLANGQIVTKTASDSIQFGSEVTVTDGKREQTFTLVSQYESDPTANKLSQESPLGQAILKKKIGDKVVVTTPRGKISYTVLSVR